MPWVTSAAAASSQSGEKPNAAIEPSSTTFPARLPDGEPVGVRLVLVRRSGARASTPPTSSIDTRRRFFAVAS